MLTCRRLPFCVLACLITGSVHAQNPLKDTTRVATTADTTRAVNPTVKAAAQPVVPTDGVWSLQECVDYAIVYNIAIKQSQLTVLSSQASLNQSRASILPNINASTSYQYSTGRVVNPRTNAYEDQTVQSNPLSLDANMNLFSGFQQINTIRQYMLLQQANQLTVEQNKNITSLNVALGYLQVLQNKELVGVAQIQVASTQAQVVRTEKLVNAGSLPQNNLLDLKAQLANDELSLVTAQNNLQLARLNLMQTMNLPANRTFDIESIRLNDPSMASFGISSQDIYEIAQNSQPNILSADLTVQSNQRAVAVARGGLLPSLSFGASIGSAYSTSFKKPIPDGSSTTEVGPYSGIDPNTSVYVDVNGSKIPVMIATTTFHTKDVIVPYFDQLDKSQNKGFRFTLSIPIFNGLQRRTQVANAVIQQKNSEYTAQNTRIQLRQSIEQAYTNMTSSAQQYIAYKNQVEALELSFKSAEIRFNVGALNSLDFTLAKNNLNRAQANLVQAKYNYVFRAKVLDFYQNKPLTF
ncbi:MAG: TolC family protein [Bacteroidota bacterium]